MKKALITGITGQDGSYLAELLLEKGYEVHGIKRRSSSFNTQRIDHLYQDPHEKNRKFILHYGDVTDSISISQIIKNVQPDEIYNLAAQSHVAVSFEVPEYTANADALGALRILEAIKFHKLEKTKFYQAGTSEMYGKVQEVPQNEKTDFYPLSPYGVAKLMLIGLREIIEKLIIYLNLTEYYLITKALEGETFVTKKIISALVKIKWKQNKLIWETWMQKEIGVMQEIMLRQCGKFYNRENQMTLLLQLENNTVSDNL